MKDSRYPGWWTSLNNSLSEMVAYRHKLRIVAIDLLEYAKDTYPRVRGSSYRELEEAERRRTIIKNAEEVLFNTERTPSYTPQPNYDKGSQWGVYGEDSVAAEGSQPILTAAQVSVEETLNFIRHCIAGRCTVLDLMEIRDAINRTIAPVAAPPAQPVAQKRLMRLPKNAAHPNFSETHEEDDWCRVARCTPVCEERTPSDTPPAATDSGLRDCLQDECDMNYRIVFYGPFLCEKCGRMICKASAAQGGIEFYYPQDIIYPNTNWVQHVCTDSEWPKEKL